MNLKKRVSQFLLTLLVMSSLTGIHNVAYAGDLRSDKTNKLVLVNSKYDENSLYGAVSEGEDKSKTFKLSVPKGSLYINIMDSNTAFKVEIIDSKDKIVKTLKSGKIAEQDILEATVSLSKGTYKVKVASLSKEKLYSYMRLAVLNTSTASDIDPNYSYSTVVQSKKTYKQSFTITFSNDYRVTAIIDVLDTKDTGVYLQKATIKDSKGKVVASQKAKNLKSMDEYEGWIVSLKEGKYTLEVTTNKSGLLDTYILDTYIGY